jgi:hypothetical protein
MNDLTLLMTFLTKTGTVYTSLTNPEFMSEEALMLNAVLCLSVRDSVDFYFNKKGRLIGSSKDSRGSFKKAEGR